MTDPEISDLPSAYPAAFRPEPASRDLVVVMSPLDRFALTKHPFGRNVLLLADKRTAYYAPQADRAAAAVMAFSRGRGCERTLFLGNSKSAYGDLLWSRLASLTAPSGSVRCLAFSPQTEIWPENANLTFASYRLLMREAAEDDGLRAELARWGRLPEVPAERAPKTLLVHCSGNRRDAVEAERALGPGVTPYPVPFGFHGSLFLFALDRADRRKVRKRVARIYDEAQVNADLLASLPARREALVQAIMAARGLPRLDALVARALGDGPFDPSPAMAPEPAPLAARLLDRLRALAGRGGRRC